MRILTSPNPMLRKVAEPVGTVTLEIKRIMEQMHYTMRLSKGIGLAAPQVGILKRIIIINIGNHGIIEQPLMMADPVIIKKSVEQFTYREGCLSLPNKFFRISRPQSINVEYTNQHNERLCIHAKNLMATCIQHEMDHLDGVLFTDHLLKKSGAA